MYFIGFLFFIFFGSKNKNQVVISLHMPKSRGINIIIWSFIIRLAIQGIPENWTPLKLWFSQEGLGDEKRKMCQLSCGSHKSVWGMRRERCVSWVVNKKRLYYHMRSIKANRCPILGRTYNTRGWKLSHQK